VPPIIEKKRRKKDIEIMLDAPSCVQLAKYFPFTKERNITIEEVQ